VSKISKKEIGRVFKLILKSLETNVDLITTGDFMVYGTVLTGVAKLGRFAETQLLGSENAKPGF